MKILLIILGLTSSLSFAGTHMDDLIRGELSAMKAYDQALSDLKDDREKTMLLSIRRDHDKASAILSKYIQGKKEILEDTEAAGPWGTFAKSWVKGAGLMSNKSALKALTQGEEHGIEEYKEALLDPKVSSELKKTIRAQLIPNQQKHIESLKRFM